MKSLTALAIGTSVAAITINPTEITIIIAGIISILNILLEIIKALKAREDAKKKKVSS